MFVQPRKTLWKILIRSYRSKRKSQWRPENRPAPIPPKSSICSGDFSQFSSAEPRPTPSSKGSSSFGRLSEIWEIGDFDAFLCFYSFFNVSVWFFGSGFGEYMVSGGELAYQQLCSEITVEFNDCSKQVLLLSCP